MAADMQELALEAIRRLDAVIERGSDVGHEEVQAAVAGVVAFRNRILAEHRAGGGDRARLDRANALVSLAYGAEFPLTGFHRQRFEQTRDGLKDLAGRG